MKPKPTNLIGANIKRRRLEKQMSQKDLSLLIGRSRVTVVLYESGSTNVPGEAIIKIAAALGCTPSDLVNSPEDLKKLEHKYLSQFKKYQVSEPTTPYSARITESLDQINAKLDAISEALDKLKPD